MNITERKEVTTILKDTSEHVLVGTLKIDSVHLNHTVTHESNRCKSLVGVHGLAVVHENKISLPIKEKNK